MADLKCSKDNWCVLMSERLDEEANSHKRGLSTLVVTNRKTSVDRLIGVSYKMSTKDRGLMLNYCPWCGEEILFDTK